MLAMTERATSMEPKDAAAVLETALRGLSKKAELTIADAAAKGGLALRDAERGLHFLSTQYRGTLSATDQGELLFKFPHGLSLPLTKKPWFNRTVDSVVGFVRGVGKFVVRAWVSIVMIGYAAVFLAIALALMFSGKSEDRGGGGGAFLYVILRVISEALFWTFHPFSPMAVSRERRAMRSRGRRTVKRFGQVVEVEDFEEEEQEKVPFYEKVNRFVFGPEPVKIDVRDTEKKIVAQIRRNAGRIGLLDVMKVTGLPREEADPLMARLLLDYDGDVDVSDDGAITYRFEGLRKTAGHTADVAPAPVWTEKVQAPAITGNPSGTNFMVGAINAFNLVAAFIALNANLTIERVFHLIQQAQSKILLPELPYDGVPLVLGVIPLFFSAVLFALPLWRTLRASKAKATAAEENARRAVLQTVSARMDAASKAGVAPVVREDDLVKAWREATGEQDADKVSAAVTRAVVELGGDVDMEAAEAGRALFRFRDLEAEVEELTKQRQQASEAEKSVGEVVFRAE